jgi:hypothetical protein
MIIDKVHINSLTICCHIIVNSKLNWFITALLTNNDLSLIEVMLRHHMMIPLFVAFAEKINFVA